MSNEIVELNFDTAPLAEKAAPKEHRYLQPMPAQHRSLSPTLEPLGAFVQTSRFDYPDRYTYVTAYRNLDTGMQVTLKVLRGILRLVVIRDSEGWVIEEFSRLGGHSDYFESQQTLQSCTYSEIIDGYGIKLKVAK